MQLSRLSILVLICFLTGCATTTTSREEADAAAILSGSSEVAGETRTAGEIAEEAKIVQTRAALLEETRCAIARPSCRQTKGGVVLFGANRDGTRNIVGDLWWTFKYTMWGQGSSKDWPWSW
jgi:hypothetical protein